MFQHIFKSIFKGSLIVFLVNSNTHALWLYVGCVCGVHRCVACVGACGVCVLGTGATWGHVCVQHGCVG